MAFLPALMLLLAFSATAGETDAKARELVDAVFKASGGDNWPKVNVIEFTFNVSEGDKVLASAKHVWNVRAGTDAVTWNGKTVAVNVLNPGTNEDAKAAHARWVNDSYWLLAPLKLKDAGVQVSEQGEQDGLQVLHLSFTGVGLTPGDQYNLYIDPKTHLVSRWDYMPSPDKKLTGTWENYRDFGGLKLATEHQFAGKRIWFSDVRVVAVAP